jgi:hypothetical protein
MCVRAPRSWPEKGVVGSGCDSIQDVEYPQAPNLTDYSNLGHNLAQRKASSATGNFVAVGAR